MKKTSPPLAPPPTLQQITIDDVEYPDALRDYSGRPPVITTSGPLGSALVKNNIGGCGSVAIVGSREATDASLHFAYSLAFKLAAAGVTVVSGGAVGIDAAAHRGALDAGGSTWVVNPTGYARHYPPEGLNLRAEVLATRDSRMIWPFDEAVSATAITLRKRNAVLAAYSRAVVVVQAHYRSGSRNAAKHARLLGRDLWIVPAAPWMGEFCGSLVELTIRHPNLRPLCAVQQLFSFYGLGRATDEDPPVDLGRIPRGAATPKAAPSGRAFQFSKGPPRPPPEPPDTASWTENERTVFTHLSLRPTHLDEILDRTAVTVPVARTALLTLSMKDVVVEGPDGFFRRKTAT